MNSIAPITARVPYHTMPGNHEIEGGTFKAYRSRFWMPASNDALYHSIDVGNAHFSMISSEMYFAIKSTSGSMLWCDPTSNRVSALLCVPIVRK